MGRSSLPTTDRLQANRRMAAEARAALEALLARATRADEGFYGRVSVEIAVQNGVLGHVREITDRTRK